MRAGEGEDPRPKLIPLRGTLDLIEVGGLTTTCRAHAFKNAISIRTACHGLPVTRVVRGREVDGHAERLRSKEGGVAHGEERDDLIAHSRGICKILLLLQ